ncbi:MAG TPA: hypothetical protein PKM34_11295 [Bacteroidales bacterium]|nr:hypothetical protein [Bacteroidales bacterium]HNQ84222.1 hypothetical protein [Bacteroidales bacterium]
MDTRKFEYLETIRETIETGDYEELDDYIEDIRDQVKADPEFQELFGEIKSRNYGDAISLIDEFIYQDIQSGQDDFFNEESLNRLGGLDYPKNLEGFTEEGVPEEISFEEFIEDDFVGGAGQEEEY